MSNNCRSEVCSSSSPRSSSQVPVTSPTGLCSTEMRCRDGPCSPTSSLGSNTPRDNCDEPSGEHRSCQSTSCNRNSGSPSIGSPGTSGISGSREGNGCLPVTSCNFNFGCPTSYRQPLSYMTCGRHPLGYLPYRSSLRNLTYRCQPFSCVSDYYRPTSYTYDRFQPYCSSLSGWRYP